MKLDPKKETVENLKHLKMQHLFNNSIIKTAMTSTQRIQIFEIQTPRKTLSVNMLSPAPGQLEFDNRKINQLVPLILAIKTSFNHCSSGSGQNSVIPVVCDVPE